MMQIMKSNAKAQMVIRGVAIVTSLKFDLFLIVVIWNECALVMNHFISCIEISQEFISQEKCRG